jgi:hypothetical protein
MTGEPSSAPDKMPHSLTIAACVILLVIIAIMAGLAPYPWYWRVGIFIGLFGFLWLIYPRFRFTIGTMRR